jgi:hypothetical protein
MRSEEKSFAAVKRLLPGDIECVAIVSDHHYRSGTGPAGRAAECRSPVGLPVGVGRRRYEGGACRPAIRKGHRLTPGTASPTLAEQF